METVSLQERNIEMLTKIKTLLVDGDEGIRRSLTLFLGYRNCRLYTVENATQALIAIKKEPYDVIICEELLLDWDEFRSVQDEAERRRALSAQKPVEKKKPIPAWMFGLIGFAVIVTIGLTLWYAGLFGQ